MENCSHVTQTGKTRPANGYWSFRYPHEVVSDPALTPDKKRAILASWASDRHAVESLPALRHLPGTPVAVTLSAIMDARKTLDQLTGVNDDDPPPPPPAAIRKRRCALGPSGPQVSR